MLFSRVAAAALRQSDAIGPGDEERLLSRRLLQELSAPSALIPQRKSTFVVEETQINVCGLRTVQLWPEGLVCSDMLEVPNERYVCP